MVALNLLLINAVIKAWEGWEIMVIYLQGEYLGISMKGKDAVIIVLYGKLAELIVLMAPIIYCEFMAIKQKW